jgi:small subunit ribosomal protein S7
MLVSMFINYLMLDGKKYIASKIFYGAMNEVQRRFPDKDPLQFFKTAIDNLKPQIEVRSKRIGGATYQVPMEIKEKTPNHPRPSMAPHLFS